MNLSVGVCYGTGPTDGSPGRDILNRYKSLGVTYWRFDAFLSSPWRSIVDDCAAVGLVPLVIARVGNSNTTDYASLCSQLSLYKNIKHVELENEPAAKFAASVYSKYAIAGSTAIRNNGSTKILIACDRIHFGAAGLDPYWDGVKVDKLLYDGIASHPYLNPHPPTWKGSFKTQQEMWDVYKRTAGDKEIWMTEFGWRADELNNNYQLVADYVGQMLDIFQLQKFNMAGIYTWTGPEKDGADFGIYGNDGSPRPVTQSIINFTRIEPMISGQYDIIPDFVLIGTPEPFNDGVAIKLPNNKYACYNSFSNWEERDAPGGGDETFHLNKSATAIYFDRDIINSDQRQYKSVVFISLAK